MALTFESDDLDEIQEFVSGAYTTLRFKARADERHLLRIDQHPLGPISLDLVDWGFGLDAVGAPLGTIDLVGMHSGTVPRVDTGGRQDGYGPGEIVHPGRFSHHYRTAYGHPPYRTLLRNT
ncbi:hypothetical protein [Amycolatopsis lurida]|uniref:hypothetical protein n=1 Tax=Amycolatopsis lurida TaxID=31959 RepID=UPI00365B5A30